MSEITLKALQFSSLCLIPNAGEHDRFEGFLVNLNGSKGTTPIKPIGGRVPDEAMALGTICDRLFSPDSPPRTISHEGAVYLASRSDMLDGRTMYMLNPIASDKPSLAKIMQQPLLAKHVHGLCSRPGIFLIASEHRQTRETYGAAAYLSVLDSKRGLGVAIDRDPVFNLGGQHGESAFSAHVDIANTTSASSVIRTQPSVIFMSALENEHEAHILLRAAANNIPCIVTVHAKDIPDAITTVTHLASKELNGTEDILQRAHFAQQINGALHIKLNETDPSKESRKIFDAKPKTDDASKLQTALIDLDHEILLSAIEHQTNQLKSSLQAANTQ
ncbi:hypothetical protein SAMN02744133_108130 [Thalassospira xiamenensis M-5 = DSM 17429]|uniref:Type II secretion system protein E n=1 Tax=Thalassospira xiamenensis M-5 = DSM 17429 TaxID=1123366 RepID=A0AB72UK05_9PROT|nr:hypothetical protein [Thalassospira xiamenensis]AJD54404.1 type II secretion system protein E [Thalassospira xiamenensis M-5 = DSM 17429]SIT21938.1 hypothetical protein SAMN02744133_108130 [Thalassospira xiamenensis M-5 = DSM 17429]